MRLIPTPRIFLAALASALVLASSAAGEEYVLVIDKMKFPPLPNQLEVGDVIVWRNDDIFRHTATDRGGTFDIDLPAGAEGRLTLAEAGSFEVYCRFHPGMKANLTVNP